MKQNLLFLLALLPTLACGDDSNFMQTSDGLVVIDAAHFQTNTAQGKHTWEVKPGATSSGPGTVLTQPADKIALNRPEEFTTKSPRLDYKITFLAPGHYYLWVRGQGAYVNLGLDGIPNPHSERIGAFPGNKMEWSCRAWGSYGQPAFVDVAAPGEHTLNLWLHTAGTEVDKIVLSPDIDYKPSSDAIAESPRAKLPPQAPWVTAGPEREINPPRNSTQLTGDARDYDGKVVSYQWSQVDGPVTATLSAPDKPVTDVGTLSAEGTYHFRLAATDDAGMSAQRIVSVKVTPGVPPTLQVPGELILITDTAVNVTAVGKDADSDDKIHPLVYKWEQVSGPSPAELKIVNRSQAALSKLIDGTYVFRASVTDFTGNTTTAETRLIKRPAPPSTEISPDDAGVQYSGRFYEEKAKDASKPALHESGWPDTAIRARFEGTSIRAHLNLGGWGGPVYFYAIIDGQSDHPLVLGGDNRSDWLIAEGLPDGAHTVELVRLSGAWAGSSGFCGFSLDPGKKLLEPPPRPSRRIEFYGDSITEGALMSDQPFGNGYLAYAASTARLLNAEASVVCKSGIGLVKGFTLPQTLPGMYDRTEPMRGDKKWDFSRWSPHVVVVNIGQNDSWTGTDPATFVSAYVKFIKTLRGHYPNAHIVCALGSMDAVCPGALYPGYVTQAVERLKSEEKETNIETFFFDFLGAKGHPNSVQAKAMAEKLAGFLEAKGPELWKESAPK